RSSEALAGLAPQQVLRPSLRLVVDAREQLADESRRDQLHADQHKQHAEEKERPAADIASERELLEGEPGEDQAAHRAEPQADATEGLQRPMQQAHQELDPEEIEQHAKRAVDAVFRLAA